MVFAAHVLMGLGILTGGVSSLVGVIIAYIKRQDTQGTYLESHCKWIIETFWWVFWISILGGFLLFVGIGVFVLAGIGIWSIYRGVMGIIRVMERQAV
jgi:uncharacterized membrane protein